MLVIKIFSDILNSLSDCADFRDPTAFFRFKQTRLLSTCAALLLLTSATQANSARIENVTLYAGKQSEVSIDLNTIDNRFINAKQAMLTPGGPYLKQRLPLLNEQAFDLVLANDHAFIATANNGLLIIDIATTITPTVVARLVLPHAAQQLSVVSNRLYVTGEQQLSIVDITQAAKPRIIGKYKTDAEIIAIDALANGSTAILLANNRLLALDTSIADKTTLHSTTTLENDGYDLTISKSRIYLAMGEAGITVLDSSDPTTITTHHRYRTSGAAINLKQSDGILYVATSSTGVTLFDIKGDEHFNWLGSHQKVGNASDIAINGEMVMVLNDENHLALLDAGMPSMPSIMATYSHPLHTQRQLISFAQHDGRLFAISENEFLEYDFSTLPPVISNEGLDFGQGVNFGGQRRGFIHGNILYVADWFSGIHLYDISEPHQPLLLSSLKTKGSPKGIVVRDDYAYVADDDYGLLIVDISDPHQPKPVATLPTPGLAYIPQLQGNLLYLASHRGGFQIIDVSDPAKPKLLSSVNTAGKAWGIQVRDDLAFIADDESGLLVFNTSNPAAPKQIGQFNPGGAAEDLLIDGNYAFVTFFDNGVYIVDISDPTNPTETSHLSTPGNARGIERKGDHLYIASWLAGMQVVDISEPARPAIVGSYDTEGAAWGLRLKGDHAYIFDWWGGLAVIDIHHPKHPRLLGHYLGNDQIQQTVARGKFLFAASGVDGLQIFEINNPLNPTWFTGVDLESAAINVTLDGDHAYVAQDNRYISIIDISNPFQAELLKQIKLDHHADIIRIANGQLYVAERGSAITTIDIKKPHAPLIRTTYHVPLIDLWNDGSTLYLTTEEQKIEIIDSSDPAKLIRQHTFKLSSNAELLRSDGSTLFLYQPDEGILMVDISAPAEPRTIGRIPLLRNISDFKIDGSTLYVAADGHYLFKYDISNPQQPRLLTQYNTNGEVDRFDIHNGVLYFSGSTNIIALQPLPETTLTIDTTTQQLTTTLPKAMPLGGYHVVISDDANHKTILYNAIKLEMKPFGNSGQMLQNLQKAMKQKQQDKTTK